MNMHPSVPLGVSRITAVLEPADLSAPDPGLTPALGRARRVARLTGSTLTLLVLESAHGERRQLTDAQYGVLFDLPRRIQQDDETGVHCDLQSVVATPAELVQRLDQTPTDLVVTSLPECRVTENFLGDGYSTLIRQTRVPVWYAEPGSKPQSGVVAAIAHGDALPGPETLKTLDYEVIETARGIVDLFDADLHLVQACEEPRAPFPLGRLIAAATAGSMSDAAEVSRIDRRERALQAFARDAGAVEECVIVAEGEVPEVISTSADTLDAGLIVMGARSKSRWETLLLGGAAEETLAKAPCDVLFVKPDDRLQSESGVLQLETSRALPLSEAAA